MTHFITAWAPRGTQLPTAAVAAIERALAPAGSVHVFRRGSIAVACWDSGLWPGRSWEELAEGGVVVAGDPVWAPGGAACSRAAAVPEFGARLPADAVVALRDAHGSFAAVAWDGRGGGVVATDKLGVRGVYVAQVEGVSFASTALWALARVPGAAVGPDLRGIIETSAFGAPLADRTLYAGIRALGAGEYLAFGDQLPRPRRYWDWTQLPPSGIADEALPAFIDGAFAAAVGARLEGQSSVFAFLSGGMDSRLLVARLRESGVDVCAMNFAPPGSQDLLFGRMAAAAMQMPLFELHDTSTDFLARRTNAFEAWRDEPAHATRTPARERLIWSGDGGSVGLGHVYLDPDIVAAARSGDFDATARLIVERNRYGVSPRIFASHQRGQADLPLRAVIDDLRSRPVVEPGRNAHLFFMLNDQRRHLVQHFERLHEHRIDLVLPFFDARFVGAVLASPVDAFLLHRLYNQVMALQPFGLDRVPWQVYPGHEACPATVADAGRQQWDEGWYEGQVRRRAARAEARLLLRYVLSGAFPADVLHRPTLAVAAALGVLGVERFAYLLAPVSSWQAAAASSRS